MTIDEVTQRWIDNEADEKAAFNGCRFDEDRGQEVVNWLYTYLRLYEGECAGQQFECLDWQYDATMRMFGWVRFSERWNREIRRFRRASIWIPKKNKKSPTLAAWALYMFAGDGEQGQKCYLAAKDGTQARDIAGKHAIEMCKSSPELMAECAINKSKMQITHVPSRSILMPLSSDDERSQQSKEGLNGSSFVDETHVVDGKFIARIIRAGISRSEPIHAEMSTVGNDPDSYGKQQWDYGKEVEAGRIEDQSLLFMHFGIDEKTTDKEIADDPAKFGKIANPAWGHTVNEEEFLDDFNMSKVTVARFADFKMYRLNQWQQATNPWLSLHDWDACPAVEGELPTDADTFGGLDLSKTTDFTSWVLYQPGDLPRCRGHYWIPEQRAYELQRERNIPIFDWARDGWVTIAPGRKIDYSLVKQHVRADIDKYRIGYVGFDPYNSDEVVRYCQDEAYVEMVECRQGCPTLSAPSKELERMVVSLGVDHRLDPVLRWMIGNTMIRMDENANIKPVKMANKQYRHIDGVVSLIMAIRMHMANPDAGRSIYDRPGALVL
jgi:phage terminase large subunit-like protein